MATSQAEVLPVFRTSTKPALSQWESPFFSLPAEVRVLIYDEVLDDPNYVTVFWPAVDRERPSQTCGSSVRMHHIETFEFDPKKPPRRRYPILNSKRKLGVEILTTCQRVFHEALPSLYEKSIFWLAVPMFAEQAPFLRPQKVFVPWPRFTCLNLAVVPDRYAGYSFGSRSALRDLHAELEDPADPAMYTFLQCRFASSQLLSSSLSCASALKNIQVAYVDPNWDIIDVSKWYRLGLEMWLLMHTYKRKSLSSQFMAPDGTRTAVLDDTLRSLRAIELSERWVKYLPRQAANLIRQFAREGLIPDISRRAFRVKKSLR